MTCPDVNYDSQNILPQLTLFLSAGNVLYFSVFLSVIGLLVVTGTLYDIVSTYVKHSRNGVTPSGIQINDIHTSGDENAILPSRKINEDNKVLPCKY